MSNVEMLISYHLTALHVWSTTALPYSGRVSYEAAKIVYRIFYKKANFKFWVPGYMINQKKKKKKDLSSTT